MAGSIPDEVVLARLRKEAAARIAADEQLGTRLDGFQEELETLTAKNEKKDKGQTIDSNAVISIAKRVIADAGYALAETVTTLDARVTDGQIDSEATITEIRRVIATQTEALAEASITLDAKINGNAAEVAETLTSYATLTFAEAKKTEAITASTAYTDASIITEQTARAAADSAEASARTTLAATVAGNTAAITTEAAARATADGNLSGMYSVQVTVDGSGNHIATGFVITSSTGPGTSVSDFIVNAANFKVNTGTGNTAPFIVSGTTVKMANAVVTGELDIGTADNRTHITSSGLTLGVITINGASNQNTIAFGGAHTVQLTGGQAAASLLLDVGTGNEAGITDSGTIRLSGTTVLSYASSLMTTAGAWAFTGDVYSGTLGGSNTSSYLNQFGNFKSAISGVGAGYQTKQAGDSSPRVALWSDSSVRFGPGSAPADVILSRVAANTLDIDHALQCGGYVKVYGAATVPTGIGLELLYDSGTSTSKINSYDRSGAVYKDLALQAATITFGELTSQRVNFIAGNTGGSPSNTSTPSSWIACKLGGVAGYLGFYT